MRTRIIPKTHHQRSGRSRLILRSTWVALAAIVLALNAAGLPASYAKYKSVCTSAACTHSEEIARLTPEGVRALRDLGLSPEFYGDYVGQVAYTIFFYVFPDGRFVPRWARWLVLVWAVLLVPDVFFPRSPLNLLDGPLFFGLIGGAVLAQVYRYWRVSTPVHRQQTKWVVFTVAVGGVGLVGTMTLVS